MRSLIDAVFQQERINFVLTNRIPRRLLTLTAGWFSRIEQPLVRDVSIGLWTLFAGDLDLNDARSTEFASLHDCFIRELKDDARPIDAAEDIVVSPCDGIVGAHGRIDGTRLFQAKDSSYSLEELLRDPERAAEYRDGWYITLRLTSTMYHRFHAPWDCGVDGVTYVSGDTWNVNPAALKHVSRLFCRNERAVIRTQPAGGSESLTLVPVAAILVASIHLNFVDADLHLRYDGPERLACRASFRKGQEMGWFQHGSTILVFATPGLRPCSSVREGVRIQMGQALLTRT